MKDYVLVTFSIEASEYCSVFMYLDSLGSDFKCVIDRFSDDNSHNDKDRIEIVGNLRAEAATVLKLQNPKLAEKMYISSNHITNELKDIYRKSLKE